MTDTIFVDTDKNTSNDWLFNRTGNVLNIIGAAGNSQDWGNMFSFSFTSNNAPAKANIILDVSNPIINQTINVLLLAPIDLFSDSFE